MNNIPFFRMLVVIVENNAYKYFVEKNGMIEKHNGSVKNE